MFFGIVQVTASSIPLLSILMITPLILFIIWKPQMKKFPDAKVFIYLETSTNEITIRLLLMNIFENMSKIFKNRWWKIINNEFDTNFIGQIFLNPYLFFSIGVFGNSKEDLLPQAQRWGQPKPIHQNKKVKNCGYTTRNKFKCEYSSALQPPIFSCSTLRSTKTHVRNTYAKMMSRGPASDKIG